MYKTTHTLIRQRLHIRTIQQLVRLLCIGTCIRGSQVRAVYNSLGRELALSLMRCCAFSVLHTCAFMVNYLLRFALSDVYLYYDTLWANGEAKFVKGACMALSTTNHKIVV